jgi:glyoxylase I family protein
MRWQLHASSVHMVIMVFEHFALNVPDARAMGQWYVDQLGFVIVRSKDAVPHTRFLADGNGSVVVELYSNPAAVITDFHAAHPLTFHFAVVTPAAEKDRARLEKAGAVFFAEDALPDGSRLIMMRDPWGVPLQLCQRTSPFPNRKTENI